MSEIIQLDSEELESKLEEVITKWPLYRGLQYFSKDYRKSPPNRITLYCNICKKEQRWQWKPDQDFPFYASWQIAIYVCRNCDKSYARYYYFWEHPESDKPGSFFKAGQYPPLEERLDPKLERQLRKKPDDVKLYKRAIRCRNFNFGLAALAYLRRVVENAMNDLLDLVAESARDNQFELEEIKQLQFVKESRVFDDKVIFASRILPPSLRPGGQNPFDLLHDLASEGIHSKSDEECIDIFDVSRHVFEYLFRELNVQKEDSQKFLKRIRDLVIKRSTRNKTP